jgi:hypothetical protein
VFGSFKPSLGIGKAANGMYCSAPSATISNRFACQLLEEWTTLAKSEALAANWELLQARDEILNYLHTERPTGA